MFKKILVPLDGSDSATKALPVAVKIAQYTGGEILLTRAPVLSNVPLPAGIEGLKLFDDRMDFRKQQCVHYLGYIRQTNMYLNVPMREHVREGDPASVILDTAELEDIDLIVMSTHGRTGLRRWLMGSVTEKVLRHATCPVLTVLDDRPFQEMVITLDGSEMAEQSLLPGLTIAGAFEAHVTLLRILEPIELPEVDDLPDLNPEELSLLLKSPEQMRQEAFTYLKAISDENDQIVLDYKLVKGEATRAAEEIVDYAELNKTDLIVMATHGDTGLDRWRYGSVTEKVVRSVPCALLIIRSH